MKFKPVSLIFVPEMIMLRQIKIGFDAKRAAQNRTGLGNYSRFIIYILSKYAPANQYFLYIPNPEKTSLLGDLINKNNIKINFPISYFWKRLRSFWRIWGITSDFSREQINLFHGLSNELPLNIRKAGNTKSIVTIHDLIFLRYPDYYHFIDRKIYTYKFKQACRKADRIIAVSECTKKDIISFFHIPQEKIDVVYQGCDASFKQPAGEEIQQSIRKKYNLPNRYILYVGSIEKRKNLLLIVRALKYCQHKIPVIAIGKYTPYANRIKEYLNAHKLEENMIMLHSVPFNELPAFYQMASVFVYPSRFEGFGIPLLEALNSGVPVIGATGSCLEEAGGPASIYIDPDDAKGLSCAIDTILSDEMLRKKMIETGKEYAKQFEEDKLASDLLKVYYKTLYQ